MKAFQFVLSCLPLVATTALIWPLACHGSPITLVCSYSKQANPQGLSPVSKKFELTFVLDTDAGKAYMIGNAGTEPVRVIEGEGRLSFVEVTATGNVMTTAVDKNGRSVHSRNTIMFGDLVPSQYYGLCEFK